MTDSSDRYGSKPLGKSVEEVEAGESNRVNSPLPGEQVRHDQQEVAVVPAVPNSNTSTTPGALLSDSVAADERRDRAQAGPVAGQTSETSEA